MPKGLGLELWWTRGHPAPQFRLQSCFCFCLCLCFPAALPNHPCIGTTSSESLFAKRQGCWPADRKAASTIAPFASQESRVGVIRSGVARFRSAAFVPIHHEHILSNLVTSLLLAVPHYRADCLFTTTWGHDQAFSDVPTAISELTAVPAQVPSWVPLSSRGKGQTLLSYVDVKKEFPIITHS